MYWPLHLCFHARNRCPGLCPVTFGVTMKHRSRIGICKMGIPPAVGWWNNCEEKTGDGSKRGGEFSFSSCCTEPGSQTSFVSSVFLRVGFILSIQLTLLKERTHYSSLLLWLGWDQSFLLFLHSYLGVKVSSSFIRRV